MMIQGTRHHHYHHHHPGYIWRLVKSNQFCARFILKWTLTNIKRTKCQTYGDDADNDITIHYNDNGDNDHADDCDDELLVGKSLDLGQA